MAGSEIKVEGKCYNRDENEGGSTSRPPQAADLNTPENRDKCGTVSEEIKKTIVRDLEKGKGVLEQRQKRQNSTIRIRRVNGLMKIADPTIYTPYYVSIGPYYHKKYNNVDIIRKEDKLASFASVFSSGGVETFVESLDLNALANEYFDLQKDEFEQDNLLQMMLYDGCYILQQLESKKEIRDKRDQDELRRIERDVLYLVENQIPFSLLDKINKETNWKGSDLVDAFGKYIIERVVEKYNYAYIKKGGHDLQEDPAHLLHLLYIYFTGNTGEPATGNNNSTSTPAEQVGSNGAGAGRNNQCDLWRWRRATEYHMANVKFKPRELNDGHARSVIDVKLKGNDTLMMPLLKIDYHTWSILRNLMALEQQNPEKLNPPRVTVYCMFLSQVACTAEDVAFLSQRRVIHHTLADNATCAKSFANLCSGFVLVRMNDPAQNYLLEAYKQLEQHAQSPPSKWMASLRQNYLSNPWVITGLTASTILLVCEILQAIFAVR